jgi:hypothetical protein
MVAVGRVVLWTLVLVAPGGFLLVPVLVLQNGTSSGGGWRERVRSLVQRTRGSVAQLQRYWTKS